MHTVYETKNILTHNPQVLKYSYYQIMVLNGPIYAQLMNLKCKIQTFTN